VTRTSSNSRSERVYLLHGLGANSWSMVPLGHDLIRSGYQVRHWRYYSTLCPAEHHAARLHAEILRADREETLTAIHFVTHSMGGIVVRAALNLGLPRSMGRVVMLAPPNLGSNIARRLGPWLGWLWKPLPQLSCDPASYVCQLPTPPGVQIGIIAGATDGRVSIAQTRLPGQTDHLVVPGGHTFIMLRREVRRQTACFLREGHFAC
jgi:pimeloyl-ACP methyl ester carboxylesterase